MFDLVEVGLFFGLLEYLILLQSMGGGGGGVTPKTLFTVRKSQFENLRGKFISSIII